MPLNPFRASSLSLEASPGIKINQNCAQQSEKSSVNKTRVGTDARPQHADATLDIKSPIPFTVASTPNPTRGWPSAATPRRSIFPPTAAPRHEYLPGRIKVASIGIVGWFEYESCEGHHREKISDRQKAALADSIGERSRRIRCRGVNKIVKSVERDRDCGSCAKPNRGVRICPARRINSVGAKSPIPCAKTPVEVSANMFSEAARKLDTKLGAR